MEYVSQLASDARIALLIAEIHRYLEAVEVFRELGHEPSWRADIPSDLVLRVRQWLEPHESQMSGV